VEHSVTDRWCSPSWRAVGVWCGTVAHRWHGPTAGLTRWRRRHRRWECTDAQTSHKTIHLLQIQYHSTVVLVLHHYKCVVAPLVILTASPWTTGGDHQDALVTRGWRLSSRTWNPTTSPWMKQLTWLRIVHSGDWCLLLALCTPSGACQQWLNKSALVMVMMCVRYLPNCRRQQRIGRQQTRLLLGQSPEQTASAPYNQQTTEWFDIGAVIDANTQTSGNDIISLCSLSS